MTKIDVKLKMELCKMTLAQMQVFADKILENNGQNGVAPVDIAKLVTSDGFSVFSISMKDDATGRLLVDEKNTIAGTNSNKVIAVNKNLSLERKRFVTAHEYAHYMLHRPMSGQRVQYAHRDYKTSSNSMEKEADAFARCLLMPADLFSREYCNFMDGTSDLDAANEKTREWIARLLAVKFNVSPRKAYQRLSEIIWGNTPVFEGVAAR